jgi:hypothetical protein
MKRKKQSRARRKSTGGPTRRRTVRVQKRDESPPTSKTRSDSDQADERGTEGKETARATRHRIVPSQQRDGSRPASKTRGGSEQVDGRCTIGKEAVRATRRRIVVPSLDFHGGELT